MRVKPAKRLVRQESDNRVRNIVLGAAAGLGIIVLGVLLYLSIQEPEALEDLKRFAGLSRGHDESVDYSGLDLPPAGGIHSGIWQNCGIYEEPVDTRNAVHSMEHGAVWIAYQPELSESEVSDLQNKVRGNSFSLLSPYPGLKSPVVLTAWGIQLEIENVNDGRIDDFIARYQQGPQTPEPGATCSDGVGSPIS